MPLDSAQRATLGLDGHAGSHWTALPPDSGRIQAVLLQDGTEAARIDSARWNQVVRARASRWDRLRLPSLDSFRSWTRPPEGLELEWTFRRSRSSHSSTLDRNMLSAHYDLPWKDWLSLGIAGGTERTYASFPLDSISGDPSRAWWAWWGGRACIRSACWEARTSDHPIPEALWTEARMDSLTFARANGSLSRRWDAPPPRSEINLQNSWTLRVGALHWRTTVDGDRWTGAEHEATLAPLGAGRVRYGLLAGTNASRAWTGIVVGVGPRLFDLPAGVGLESAPATFILRYADVNCLSFEIRTSLRILPPWSLP